jgi:hypothetical protein
MVMCIYIILLEIVHICKPHTDFTKEWYNEMINCMDEKYEKLQQYPSRKPDEQREVDD